MLRTLPAAAAVVLALAAAGPASAEVQVAFLQGEQVRYVDRPGATASDAVGALIAGPTAAERAREITSTVPSGTTVAAVTVDAAGVATVDLGRRFARGRKAEILSARIAQLVLTATKVPGVRSVRVLITGGTPLGLFPGYATKFPITAADVRDEDVPPPAGPPPAPQADPTAATRALQSRLADLGYLPRAGVDGKAGPQTRFAVMAFQKWEGLARDGDAGPATRAALVRARRPTPRTRGSGRRVEVLLDRQLALYIERGRVVRMLHVATGARGFETPTGNFKVFRKEQRSWSIPYKVWLPWASYFVGGVAFHESPDVPSGAGVARMRARAEPRRALALRPAAHRHAGHRAGVLAMSVLRAIAATVLAAALLAPPPASAQAPTKTPGELVAGLSMPAAGFQVGAVRGRDVLFARGLEIDLARAIATELAIPRVRFVNDERFSTLLAPGPRDWDLALAQITITDERSARFAFSRPYFRADQGVLLRRGLSLRSRTLRALRRLRLCAERGSTGAAAIRRDVRPTRNARVLRTFSRLEADLYQRRCDAVIADAPQLGVLRAQAPDRVGALVGRIATGESYGIAFEPGSALRPLVDGALARLDRDGTLGRLARRWLSADVSGLPVLR